MKPANSTNIYAHPPGWRDPSPTANFVPRITQNIVRRTRLEERLDNAASSAVTLIIAPVGFGKSTLLANWLRRTSRHVCWYSIEEREATLDFFLYHLSVSLSSAHSSTETSIHSPSWRDQPNPEILTWRQAAALLFQLMVQINIPTTVVLDDFQYVKDDRINKCVLELVTKLPENINIVISSRTAPALPLTKLRARGLIREIGTDDLRFTDEEAATFLQKIMNLSLSPGELHVLLQYTEGWIVGLQLAAICLQDGATVTDIISADAEPLKHTLVYLIEEVLAHQPDDVQKFLLETSILDRLTSSLCDYVTQSDNSAGMIQRLVKENLFIVPMDDDGNWYRYHHLFRTLLAEQLAMREPSSIPGLIGRACQWFEDQNYLSEAVACAVAREDWEKVDSLIQSAIPILLLQTKDFRDWLATLPSAAFEAQPRLACYQAWSYLLAGNIRACNRMVNALAHKSAFDSPIYIQLAIIRSAAAFANLDCRNAVRLSQPLLGLTENIPSLKYSAVATCGLAHWAAGDWLTAERMLAQAVESLLEGGINYADIAMRFGGSWSLLQALNGQLMAAEETFGRLENVHTTTGKRLPPSAYATQTHLHYLRNELSLAEAKIGAAQEVIHQTGVHILTPWLWQEEALIELGRGDIKEALKTTDQLRDWCKRNGNDGWLKSTIILRMRILLEAGNYEDVEAWLSNNAAAHIQTIDYDDEPIYSLAIRAAIHRSISLADHSALPEAADIGRRLAAEALRCGRSADAASYNLLLSGVMYLAGEKTEALSLLDNVAKTYLAEGVIRPILDQRTQLLDILQREITSLPGYQHLTELLSVLDKYPSAQPTAQPPSFKRLVMLSEREHEVLGHLAVGLTNAEIADILYVSVNTIKTHIKNIYFKLNAHTRTHALAIAREANLV